MDVLTIESSAIQEIMDKLNAIEKRFFELETKAEYKLQERWLDNQEVMILLNISKRTLQSYRDEALIPFSQIGGKVYYRACDIEKFLKRHYQKIPGQRKY
jgi:hypothetical protein